MKDVLYPQARAVEEEEEEEEAKRGGISQNHRWGGTCCVSVCVRACVSECVCGEGGGAGV